MITVFGVYMHHTVQVRCDFGTVDLLQVFQVSQMTAVHWNFIEISAKYFSVSSTFKYYSYSFYCQQSCLCLIDLILFQPFLSILQIAVWKTSEKTKTNFSLHILIAFSNRSGLLWKSQDEKMFVQSLHSFRMQW